MSKRYGSIADLIEDSLQDKEYADTVREKIAGRRISKLLVQMRAVKGRTQSDVAEAMGCRQSQISRMEHGQDDLLRLTEVARYAMALGFHMKLYFDDPEIPRAERVKGHVFRIKQLLDELADLAGEDHDMKEKIKAFYGEVLLNFLLQFGESCQKLGALDVGQSILEEDDEKIEGNAIRVNSQDGCCQECAGSK